MPGSGKTHFGEKLAAYLDLPLIDLDAYMESQEQKTIQEIFNSQGEEVFRRLEAAALREISTQHPFFILSTGGGTPCFHDGMAYMNEVGITVFLDADESVLIKRLNQKNHRPLVQGDAEQKVMELLQLRLAIYQQAQITISHRDPKDLVAQIESLKS